MRTQLSQIVANEDRECRIAPSRSRASFLLAAALATGAILALAGCNTTEGIGKDIKSVGKGIEEAASDAKD